MYQSWLKNKQVMEQSRSNHINKYSHKKKNQKEINTHGHRNTKRKSFISSPILSFKRTKKWVNFKAQCQLFLNYVILFNFYTTDQRHCCSHVPRWKKKHKIMSSLVHHHAFTQNPELNEQSLMKSANIWWTFWKAFGFFSIWIPRPHPPLIKRTKWEIIQ